MKLLILGIWVESSGDKIKLIREIKHIALDWRAKARAGSVKKVSMDSTILYLAYI